MTLDGTFKAASFILSYLGKEAEIGGSTAVAQFCKTQVTAIDSLAIWVEQNPSQAEPLAEQIMIAIAAGAISTPFLAAFGVTATTTWGCGVCYC
jgi:hypothetical protein